MPDLEERVQRAIEKVPLDLGPDKVEYNISEEVELNGEGVVEGRMIQVSEGGFAIVIFYSRAISYGCGGRGYTSEEIDKRLYDIVVHELGHHAGFSDAEMLKRFGM